LKLIKFFLFLLCLVFLKACAPAVVAVGVGAAGGYKANELMEKKDNSSPVSYKNFTITPETVKKGDKITVKIEYKVSDATTGAIEVKETSILLYKADDKDPAKPEELTTLDKTTVTREKGKWEIKFSFYVPADAKSGEYIVRQTLSVTTSSSWSFDLSEERSFKVI